jgi:formate dehydrogenase major subunit
MIMSRRDFLKVSGGTTGAALAGFFGTREADACAFRTRLRIRYAAQSTTICPYCGCGCGLIVSARDGKIINIEGDPDHPVNRGSVCSKGGALFQVANNERRMTHVLYRAPGGNSWQKKPWKWAINRISQLVKETRDKELADGRKVNRVNSIAAIGGAALDNEECYLYSKLMRALGIVYIEHQARI